MALLKPERTFAEKLLALHADMSAGVDGARRVRTRHYYDVARLFQRSEDVRASVRSGALLELVRDAARMSNAYFGTQIDVEEFTLNSSPALDPTADQFRRSRRNTNASGLAQSPRRRDQRWLSASPTATGSA